MPRPRSTDRALALLEEQARAGVAERVRSKVLGQLGSAETPRESAADYVKRHLGHASIKLTVDTYGRWLRMENKAAVDRLDDRSGSK